MPLSRDAEAAAFHTLHESPKRDAIVSVASELLSPALRARRLDWPLPANVVALAERYDVGRASKTAFGDCLELLMRPPESDSEAALAHAIFAHVLAESAGGLGEERGSLAGDLLWMAAHTPFNAFGLLDLALGEGASTVWKDLLLLVREIDEGRGGEFGPSEAVMAAALLGESDSEVIGLELRKLRDSVHDPVLARVLQTSSEGAPALVLSGRELPATRGPLVTVLLGATGLLLAMHLFRLISQLAFGRWDEATVAVRPSGLQITRSRSLFGKPVRKVESRIPSQNVSCVMAESTESRGAVFAGVAAFAAGSYLGMGLVADGVRAASPALLGRALLVLAVGILLELVFGRILPSPARKHVVSIVPRDGKPLRIAVKDDAAREALLARYAR